MQKINTELKSNLCAGKMYTRSNATFGIGKENLFGLGLSFSMVGSHISTLSDIFVNEILESKGYSGNYNMHNQRIRIGSNLARSGVTY